MSFDNEPYKTFCIGRKAKKLTNDVIGLLLVLWGEDDGRLGDEEDTGDEHGPGHYAEHATGLLYTSPQTAQLINNDVTNAQYRLGGQIHGVYKFVGPTYTDFL